jgi:hypothetical protein
MCRTSARFDFRNRVAYDPEAKRLFHIHARRQLLKLAAVLGPSGASGKLVEIF